MQAVAPEMNLSETAFLLQQTDGCRVRWFTPAVEVELCGLATLASAYVVWEEGHVRPDEEARFHTLSGLLTAVRNGTSIRLDFPATPAEPAPPPPALARAVGAEFLHVGRSRFDFLSEVESEHTVHQLQPDFAQLRALPAPGIIVTSRASVPGYDSVSRLVAPACAADEDPVTGSAHCCLGPYWGRQLRKRELRAYQASARGGSARVIFGKDRAWLEGEAVTVVFGELI